MMEIGVDGLEPRQFAQMGEQVPPSLSQGLEQAIKEDTHHGGGRSASGQEWDEPPDKPATSPLGSRGHPATLRPVPPGAGPVAKAVRREALLGGWRPRYAIRQTR